MRGSSRHPPWKWLRQGAGTAKEPDQSITNPGLLAPAGPGELFVTHGLLVVGRAKISTVECVTRRPPRAASIHTIAIHKPRPAHSSMMLPLRSLSPALRSFTRAQSRRFSTPASSKPFPPRHLLSIADLSTAELTALVQNARRHKSAIKGEAGDWEIPLSLRSSLAGRTVAMTFSKRSTRTRVSTEGAVAALGGSPMFLGKDDIQLGV